MERLEAPPQPEPEEMMKRHPRSGLLAISVVIALVLGACGDGETADTDATSSPDTAGDTTPATTTGETTPDGDGEPIRIGTLTDLTGNFTPWGLHVRDGMQLSADHINAAGGVNGRMIELVVADAQANPEEGVTAFERLIEQDGVVAAGGIISSDVGLATSRVAEELQVPLFLVKAGATDILTPNSRFTFRTCLPSAPMVAGPVLQYVQSQGLTRVGAIIADYAWGQAVRAAIEDTFAEAPDIELQIEVAPVGESDFTTYLRALEGLDPEMIVATGHPPGTGPIVVQSADLGFDVPITGSYTPRSLVVGGVAEAAIDRYADFGCADVESPEWEELAREYVEFSADNTFLEDDAVASYGIVQVVAEAVGEVGDDPVAVSEYLHSNTFDLPGYSFEMEWTEWGELANAQIAFDIISQGPAPEGVNEGGEWFVDRLLVSEPLEPYQP